MKQLLKDITIRRMILGTLLTISVLLAGMSAITINGLRGSADALTDSTELLHEVSALSRVNDQIMRARLRLSRQMEYAAAGDATQAAEEGRSIDAALAEARKQQAIFLELAGNDAPAAILDPHEIGLRGPDRGGHRGPARPADGRRCGARPRPWRRPGRDASRAFGKSIEQYEPTPRNARPSYGSAAAKRRHAYIGTARFWPSACCCWCWGRT